MMPTSFDEVRAVMKSSEGAMLLLNVVHPLSLLLLLAMKYCMGFWRLLYLHYD